MLEHPYKPSVFINEEVITKSKKKKNQLMALIRITCYDSFQKVVPDRKYYLC